MPRTATRPTPTADRIETVIDACRWRTTQYSRRQYADAIRVMKDCGCDVTKMPVRSAAREVFDYLNA